LIELKKTKWLPSLILTSPGKARPIRWQSSSSPPCCCATHYIWKKPPGAWKSPSRRRWRKGLRTADIYTPGTPGTTKVSTRQMGDAVLAVL
jgi:hypothetical protein